MPRGSSSVSAEAKAQDPPVSTAPECNRSVACKRERVEFGGQRRLGQEQRKPAIEPEAQDDPAWNARGSSGVVSAQTDDEFLKGVAMESSRQPFGLLQL